MDLLEGTCVIERCLFNIAAQAYIPSMFGMFVYSEQTCIVHRRLSAGNGGRASSLEMKRVVSLM